MFQIGCLTRNKNIVTVKRKPFLQFNPSTDGRAIGSLKLLIMNHGWINYNSLPKIFPIGKIPKCQIILATTLLCELLIQLIIRYHELWHMSFCKNYLNNFISEIKCNRIFTNVTPLHRLAIQINIFRSARFWFVSLSAPFAAWSLWPD